MCILPKILRIRSSLNHLCQVKAAVWTTGRHILIVSEQPFSHFANNGFLRLENAKPKSFITESELRVT